MNHRRTRFIQEMGIGPVWKRRGPEADERSANHDSAAGTPAGDHKSRDRDIPSESFAVSIPATALTDLKDEAQVPHAATTLGAAPAADEVARMDWAELKHNVAACVKCRLCQTRTKTVFGVGDEKAGWLFVGEGPGRSEDAKGEPFVGPAGKLLDNMLLSLGLRRGENAYIANTVKCRPIGPDGRDRPPALDEAEACRPYLERQIDLIQPKIIIALGKTAAISLLGLDSDTPVTKLRGRVHQYRDLPLIVTYHPAYLLRKLSEKGKAWSDLCLAMRTYGDVSR
ncbi:uracil-DNA glycosylase [Oxalobacteraceae bacterium R-40]|uniref:Type-4 uracil-DNA glycosylase n=1 Tax=Keguizhuia sedimenti TaxID=3064264 RepID=A0ABU1BNM6_9BURK|nr:uracil-DNA glycosylase [Oxalobacteraceae bacterium R-40]